MTTIRTEDTGPFVGPMTEDEHDMAQALRRYESRQYGIVGMGYRVRKLADGGFVGERYPEGLLSEVFTKWARRAPASPRAKSRRDRSP